jgi:hypothetical protein
MKLHRDSLENIFINHHNQLKLGAHQAKNKNHQVDYLMDFSLCKSTLFLFQHTLKHSNFFLILQNKLPCVLEQEKL